MTAPLPLKFVAVSSSGVDAAGRRTSPLLPVTDMAADAAPSRRQHQPADTTTRLAGVAPASTHLYFAVVAYLHKALPHTWRPEEAQ